MKFLSWPIRVVLLLLLAAQPACAASKNTDPEKEIRAALTKQFPKHKLGEIRKTPVAGIYEVAVGKEVVYSDSQGKYVLFGDLVNLEKQESLTEERKAELMKTAFAELPLDAAIKVVRGKGERKLAIFTDPDCPYCKQLDRVSLKPLDNVTLYYFLLPLDQLHPDARRKSINVWCSADRAKAWFDLIYEDKEAAEGKCDHPLDKVAATAKELGFGGTPGLLFADGTKVPGAIPTERIEAVFSTVSSKK